MFKDCCLAALALVILTTPATAAPAMADPLAIQRLQLPETEEIDLALSAAPQHLRAGARVMVFGATGYREARAGANGFTCLVNRDSFLQPAPTLKPTCWDRNGKDSYVPVMLRVGEMLAKGATAKAIEADIDDGFARGRFRSPERVGVAYMLAGDLEFDAVKGAFVRQRFPGHYMFYAVGIANEDLGYSQAAATVTPGLPFVFSRGAGGSRLGYIISGYDHAH